MEIDKNTATMNSQTEGLVLATFLEDQSMKNNREFGEQIQFTTFSNGSTTVIKHASQRPQIRRISRGTLKLAAIQSDEKVGQSLAVKIAKTLVGKTHTETQSSNRMLHTVYPSGLTPIENPNIESQDHESDTPLVYGKPWQDEDSVIFAPIHRVTTLITIHNAVRNSSTWGQFREKVSDSIYREAVSASGNDHEPLSNDHLEIGAYDDGDWPGFLAQEMINWMPKDAQALGIIKPTIFNGDYLLLNEDDLDQIIGILTLKGYQIVQNESSLRKAMDLPT